MSYTCPLDLGSICIFKIMNLTPKHSLLIYIDLSLVTSKHSPLMGDSWLCVSREVTLGVGTQVFGGTCGTISWQVRSPQGKYHSYSRLHRFLFIPFSSLPPTFCVTQREEFSLLGVFFYTGSGIIISLFQIVELSIRLIVMWSVPFNLNLYDTYMGLLSFIMR